MNPATSAICVLVDEDRQQRAATVLVDVAYVIEAHFELTPKAGAERQRGQASRYVQSPRPQGPVLPSALPRHARVRARFEFRRRIAPPPRPSPTPRASAGARATSASCFIDIDHRATGRPRCSSAPGFEDGVMRVPHPNSPEIRR